MNKCNLIVLGMHRSGTSCLTGLLQESGVYLGEVVESARYNLKGNRENLEVRNLNDRVLAFNDAAWDSPPNQALKWNQELSNARDDILRKYANIPVWGFKDPRTVLTLPFWIEGMAADKIKFIATFRHPMSVAKSLNSRDPSLSIEKGLQLWTHYNKEILEINKHNFVPIIDFNLDSDKYLRSFKIALSLLDLPDVSSEAELNFFDESLRHQSDQFEKDMQTYSSQLAETELTYDLLKVFSHVE